MSMIECNILTPAFSILSCNYNSILAKCAENLGINTSDIELFGLVPLKDIQDPMATVIRFKSSNFSLSKLEELLAQREQLLYQIQNAREAMCIYSEKLKEQKEVSSDDKFTRKVVKLEDDNKKLRTLLKYDIFRTQLDNSENLRLATQKTVENLREEFDLLVRELVNVKGPKQKYEETPKTEKKSVIPKLRIGAT